MENGNLWSPNNTSWRTWVARVFSRLLFFILSNTIDSGVHSVNPINRMLLLSFLNCKSGCMDISSMMSPSWNPARGGDILYFCFISHPFKHIFIYSHQPLDGQGSYIFAISSVRVISENYCLLIHYIPLDLDNITEAHLGPTKKYFWIWYNQFLNLLKRIEIVIANFWNGLPYKLIKVESYVCVLKSKSINTKMH